MRFVVAWIVAAAAVARVGLARARGEHRRAGRRLPRRRAARDPQRGAAADPRRAAPAVHARHGLPARARGRRRWCSCSRPRCCPTTSTSATSATRCVASLLIAAVQHRAAGAPRHERRRRVHRARHAPRSRAAWARTRAPTSRASSSSRSTGSRCRCCVPRCATAARRTWPAGSPTTATASPSGRRTCRRRPARARPGSCSAPTRTSPRSAGSRRRTSGCSCAPRRRDCAEIERRHATGIGLLIDGGASRGNLLSGEAEDVILTVSRTEAEREANPGYRAFLANGFNVTRALVLFLWEIGLEVTAVDAGQAPRRAAARAPRRHLSAACAAAMCVIVRDLIVFGVLTDMMRGRPAVYATFSSYDEVAHHSGLMRADTLEALRKLDQQFGRLAARAALRPAPVRDRRALRPRPDPGRDVQAAQRLRARRAGRAIARPRARRGLRRRRRAGRDGRPRGRRGDGPQGEEAAEERRLATATSSSSAPGNLGLVYLMEAPQRLTREEIDERHPELIPALREHPHIGWLLVRSAEHGAVVLGPGRRALPRRRPGRGRGPAGRRSPPPRRRTCCAPTASPHVADLMIGSFYDPVLDEGCAFEELISFHGGLGGPQTQAVHPVPARAARSRPSRSSAPPPCTAVLSGWRAHAAGRRRRARPAGAGRRCTGIEGA